MLSKVLNKLFFFLFHTSENLLQNAYKEAELHVMHYTVPEQPCYSNLLAHFIVCILKLSFLTSCFAYDISTQDFGFSVFLQSYFELIAFFMQFHG